MWARCLSKIAKDEHSGCWNWTGSKFWNGYGRVGYSGTSVNAHRFFYLMTKGPIPPRRVIMHSCDNRGCVNPAHLSAGTHKENSQDAQRKGRLPIMPTHAKLGEADVVKIKQRIASGAFQREIAKEFGVTQSNISQISLGKTWSHIN